MNRRRKLVLLASGAFLVTVPFCAYAKLGDARNASIVAATVATSPLAATTHFKIEAKTSELRIDESVDGTVTVTVPLANLDTGIRLRNSHLREKYLHADRYPNAELSVARGALRFPSPGGESSGSAGGTMSLHGVRRPVSFTYSARRDGSSYTVRSELRININDYGIETPSFLGVSVRPEVDVTAAFVVTDW